MCGLNTLEYSTGLYNGEFRVSSKREQCKISEKSSHQLLSVQLIMWCMGIGYACIIISQFLTQYLFYSSLLVCTYGPCLFNYLYGTAYYRPLLVTQQQIQALNLSHEITRSATIILAIIATISIGSPYILSTVVFFGGILVQKLKYRYGMIRTRFTPNLTRHLLS